MAARLSTEWKGRAMTIETAPESVLAELIKLGHSMRDCQNRYFKTRDRSDLIASRQAESVFDKFLKLIEIAP
jgi:hypothetical protein